MKNKWWQLTSLILGWRVALAIIVAISFSFISYRPDFSYTSVNHFARYPTWAQRWLSPWANFDGVHYLMVAGNGYVDQERFLPLFPGVIAGVGKLLGDPRALSLGQVNVGFLVSHIIFIAMIITGYQLWRLDFSEETTRWSILLLLAFPTSFFLVSVYSESLFLLLAGLTLLLIRKDQWWRALLPASLLTITRLTGFVIIPTMIVLAWEMMQKEASALRPVKKLVSSWLKFLQQKYLHVISAALTIIPLILYAYYNFIKYGDWLYFVHAHGQLGNSRETAGLVFPLVTLYRYFKILTSLSPQLYEYKVAVMELVFLAVSAGIFIWAALKKIRWSYLVFAGLAISIPILSGTLTGLPRYSLAAIPLLPALAQLPKPWRWSLLITGLIIQVILLAAFSRGYFIA